MKLVMDEKLKHRLIGLAVIISLGAIFAPAVMRKSSQRMENNFSVNIKLPPKPVAPDVAVTDEKDMFKTIKIARVRIPPVSSSKAVINEPVQSQQIANNYESQLAKIQTQIKPEAMTAAIREAAKVTAKNTVKVAANKTPVKQVASIPVRKKPSGRKVQLAKAQIKPAVAKNLYALQLASFSQQSNAQSLVNRLQGRGYKASYIRVSGRQGTVYKVFAGHSPSKNDVVRLKTQLASSMQLKGFVVNTGVS